MVDLGDDEYTVGRPHPMIDFRLRSEQVIEAVGPEEVLQGDPRHHAQRSPLDEGSKSGGHHASVSRDDPQPTPDP